MPRILMALGIAVGLIVGVAVARPAGAVDTPVSRDAPDLAAVRAKIAAFDSFSGHADRSELVRYVQNTGGDIKKIAVIHGEEQQSLAFAETLRTLKPAAEVLVPVYQQTMDVG